MGSGPWGFIFMVQVSIYIDGFNLYHAIRNLKDNRAKWLDLRALSQRLVRNKSETIVSINYFSAYATWLPGPYNRHMAYISALRSTGVNCIMGHFKSKDRSCKCCGAQWTSHEEKETDVNIGIHLVRDAFKGKYDGAYLITRDSDLVPAVNMVKKEFPSKQITIVAPPLMGHSTDLLNACDAKQKIKPKKIMSCLLPEKILDTSGEIVATRPSEYATS
jgi:uncharacterized LabA/DUF88 family protein